MKTKAKNFQEFFIAMINRPRPPRKFLFSSVLRRLNDKSVSCGRFPHACKCFKRKMCITQDDNKSTHGHVGITCVHYFIPSVLSYIAQGVSRHSLALNSTSLLSYTRGKPHNQRNKYREIRNTNNRYYATDEDT